MLKKLFGKTKEKETETQKKEVIKGIIKPEPVKPTVIGIEKYNQYAGKVNK